MALSISSAMQAAQYTSPRLAEGSRGVPRRRAADARAGAAAEVDVNHLPRRMVPPRNDGAVSRRSEAARLKERVQLDCGEAFYDPAKESSVGGTGRPLGGFARAPRSCTSTLGPLSQKHTEVLASCRSSLTASPLESQCGGKARRRGPAEHAVGQTWRPSRPRRYGRAPPFPPPTSEPRHLARPRAPSARRRPAHGGSGFGLRSPRRRFRPTDSAIRRRSAFGRGRSRSSFSGSSRPT